MDNNEQPKVETKTVESSPVLDDSIKLFQKILNVMSKIEAVEKKGHNDFHKYDYAREIDILTAIRKEIIDQKLVIVPSVEQRTKEGEVTVLHVLFKIFDAETGYCMTSTITGTGQDKGDKGDYKALTGAVKYFLLKTFLIPTDDDPENEKKSSNIQKKSTSSAANAETRPTGSGVNNAGGTCQYCHAPSGRPHGTGCPEKEA